MKKNLPILGFTLAILVAIAFFMQTPTGRNDLSGSQLLKKVKLEEVKKIIIQKGEEKTTLIRNKDGYSIEEKEGYKADTAKTASLLVELLNMKGAEWITSKKEKHANFGLSDDNKEALVVTLLSDNDSDRGGLIIGNTARSPGDNQGNYAFGSSRYVRIKGEENVFLVSKVTPLQARPATWIARELLQIKGQDIANIEVKHAESKESFKLKNKGNSEFEPVNFTVPKGRKLKKYVINNLSNTLSNLRLTDSIKEENNSVKDLSFDTIFIASLTDGREYKVFIAQKEEGKEKKNYIKISASFAEVKEADEKESSSQTKNPWEVAEKDRERFDDWVFEVTDTSHFTYKKNDLFEDE